MVFFHRIVVFFLVFLLVGLAFPLLAQDTASCSFHVRQAVNGSITMCRAFAYVGPNQVCYGNATLEAQPQAAVTDFNLEKPGDIEDVIHIQSLKLSPMDVTSEEWGIALMRLQANLPDTLPGQNVTLVAFGNVEIENASGPAFDLTVSKQINARSRPSTDAEVVGNLRPGYTWTADGRSRDREWIRFQSWDDSSRWVYAPLVNLDGDIMALPVAAPGEPVYTPMQAFYFQSGIGDAPCVEAPHSGILIQTPESAAEVQFSINGVNIRLGSTVFLQAGDKLLIYVIEGLATVTAFDVQRLVPSGTYTTVPLDTERIASGPPNEPTAYPESDVAALPVRLLPNMITIAAPLAEDAIEKVVSNQDTCTVSAAQNVNLRTGPGTVYSQGGSLAAGESTQPNAQANGLDGYIWWRLPDGNWVRTDVINTTGACQTLPVIVDLPPTPTPDPVVSQPQSNDGGGSSGLYYWYTVDCELQGGQVNLGQLAGQTIRIGQGVHRFPTQDEAEAARGGHYPIIMDGVALPVSNGPIEWQEGTPPVDTGPGGWGFSAYADWVATPGIHTLISNNYFESYYCSLTIEP